MPLHPISCLPARPDVFLIGLHQGRESQVGEPGLACFVAAATCHIVTAIVRSRSGGGPSPSPYVDGPTGAPHRMTR